MALIAQGLERAGIEVHIATTQGSEDDRVSSGQQILSFPRQTEFYKISLPLVSWLSRNVHAYDLVHIHGLFSFASYAAASKAKKSGVPYVVRPLGVLNQWGLQNRRRLLKRLSFALIEKRIIANAAAMHYTSQAEKVEAAQAGVEKDSYVIPLGVDARPLEHLPNPDRFFSRYPNARGREIVLFLSRVDQKKGLDRLIRAFAQLNRLRPEALLVIAGTGESHFVEALRNQSRALGIADEIIWTGFVTGEDKLSAIAAASIFALPSSSENFGIAAVEALAAGLPCVLSDQIGIVDDVREYDAGLVTACDDDELVSALLQLSENQALRVRLSANARRLAAERFSVEAMTRSITRMYNGVLSERASGWRQLIPGVTDGRG